MNACTKVSLRLFYLLDVKDFWSLGQLCATAAPTDLSHTRVSATSVKTLPQTAVEVCAFIALLESKTRKALRPLRLSLPRNYADVNIGISILSVQKKMGSDPQKLLSSLKCYKWVCN